MPGDDSRAPVNAFTGARERRRWREGSPYHLAADDALPDELLEERIMPLLEALDFDQRAVFVMYDVNDMTVSEIAEVLEVPINTIYSRLRLARAEIARAETRLLAQQR